MYVHIPQSVINLLPLFQFLQMKSLLAVLTTWPKLSVVAFNFDLNLIYKFYSKKAAQVGSSFWNTSELIKQQPAKKSTQSKQEVWINSISYDIVIFEMKHLYQQKGVCSFKWDFKKTSIPVCISRAAY